HSHHLPAGSPRSSPLRCWETVRRLRLDHCRPHSLVRSREEAVESVQARGQNPLRSRHRLQAAEAARLRPPVVPRAASRTRPSAEKDGGFAGTQRTPCRKAPPPLASVAPRQRAAEGLPPEGRTPEAEQGPVSVRARSGRST